MIIHVDMDAFYASVEERDDPSLRGRPLVVAGSVAQRGVVSAASYAARAFGIASAMPTARAVRLCRELVIVPVRMAHYAAISAQLRAIFHRYTPLVEPLSLDEAFLDTNASTRLHGPPRVVARRIKQEIADELGLVASVGVAPNKFLAKLASDHDKPDGFTVVEPGAVQVFLDPMPVSRLWGVGAATLARLVAMDIHTVADLRRRDREECVRRLGRVGDHLHRLAHGEDERPVRAEREAKSMSQETTFAEDIDQAEVLEAVLMQLTESVCARARAAGRLGRTVTVKIRDAGFSTITPSRSLAAPTDVTAVVYQAARSLLRERWRPATPLRLLGVGLSRFDHEEGAQADLFANADRTQSRIDVLSDQVRARFGPRALARGSGLKRPR